MKSLWSRANGLQVVIHLSTYYIYIHDVSRDLLKRILNKLFKNISKITAKII